MEQHHGTEGLKPTLTFLNHCIVAIAGFWLWRGVCLWHCASFGSTFPIGHEPTKVAGIIVDCEWALSDPMVFSLAVLVF